MAFEVYCITNLNNGKKYVGITAKGYKNRFANHIWHARKERPSCRALYNSMRKHGSSAFSVELLQTAESFEHMNQLEREWIERLGTMSPNGYNLTDGGGSASFCDETKRIMSDRLKGKPMSKRNKDGLKKAWANPEIRANRIVAIREAMNRPETREATGARQRGKPKSENHIKALRRARSKAVICVDTGQAFEAMIDAVRWVRNTQNRPTANHAKILRAMKSQKYTAYGYRWQYA
jgi:group I intron endonuclease